MNSCSRRRVLPVLAAVLALFASAGNSRAEEIVDGNNPPTVRNNMHSCPAGRIVAGINVAANQLLCTSRFEDGQGFLTVNEIVDQGATATNQWPPNQVTRVSHNYTGPSMHWCGPNRFVTGVHVLNNAFNCSEFISSSNRNYTTRLGHLIVDTGTVRNGVRSCPRGTILVGAHFSNNALLCAELPFCEDVSDCPSAADACEFTSVTCPECIGMTTGVCRRPGSINFREGNNCTQDNVGFMTDRSGSYVTEDSTNEGFVNDEARSLSLTNLKAGTILRLYDHPNGSQGDDWTQIFAKTALAGCLGSFESSSQSASLVVEHHPVNGLDGKVSLVTSRSALIDFGGRCVDVNMNNNAAQIFSCHAGPNQSWIYEVDGKVRGFNDLCLEASNSDIQNWPNLAGPQLRRAAVRVAACNNQIHQKWSVTEAGQLRMFSDMCLGIVGGTSQNNALLQIQPCSGVQSQRWVSSF